mmetsp:Transcript_20717/g.44182  ORF Transcript_20717/g.44182 Transcript_20717/m.44182 type:complete len:279 (+) Transcript_20717:4583-5419(+)
MMHAESSLEQVHNLLAPALLQFLLPIIVLLVLRVVKIPPFGPFGGPLGQCVGCLVGVAARMDEDHDLVSLSDLLQHQVVGNLVQLDRHPHRILLQETDEGGVQWNGPVGGVEAEQVLVLDPQEARDVGVVRQRRGQANEAHGLAGGLLEAEAARHDRLDDGSSVVVEQVNFIDDDELDQLLEGVVSGSASTSRRVSRHDIPFLGHCHDDVNLLQLLLRQGHVSRQLCHDDSQWPKSLLELLRDLADQGLHWGHVDHFEVSPNTTRSIHVLTDESEDGQ